MKIATLYTLTLVLIVLATDRTPSNAQNHEELIEHRQIVLPTSDFEITQTEKRLQEFLAKRSPTNRLLLVEAMDREKSSALSAIGFTDVTYGLWKLLFSEYEQGIPPFAELIGLNGNVAMRVRDIDGRVTVKVLEGRSPYEISGCGASLSLLHIGITQTKSAANLQESLTNVHFFVLSQGAVEESIAHCALRKIEDLKLTKSLAVSLRRDPWFIEDSDYPVVLPFLTSAYGPSKEEYETAPQWRCSSYEGKTICSGHGAADPGQRR